MTISGPVPNQSWQDNQHLHAYRDALRRGDHTQALAVGERVIAEVSQGAEAFAFLANEARKEGNPVQATTWAERGLSRFPTSADLQFHLGLAAVAERRFDAAEQALRQAIGTQPEHLLARLALGDLYAQLGRTEDCLKACVQGWALAENTGVLARWDTASADVKESLQRALQIVLQARAQVLTQALHSVRQRHGTGSIRRVHQALQDYLQGRTPPARHPLQQPSFLFVPGLPDRPWFERSDFPFLASLEDATDDIRQELYGVLADPERLRPYVDMAQDAPAAPLWRDLIQSSQWSAFHLYRHGEQVEENCRLCPRTMAALERIPLHRVPEHGPEVLFSVLRPHTRIPPHTGVINGRLTAHLPLIVPPNCGALRAGGEARAWREGECLIFDDSFVHEAWNDSDEVRVVLIFDLWNPYLTAAEQEALAAAIDAIGKFNRHYGGNDPMEEAPLPPP